MDHDDPRPDAHSMNDDDPTLHDIPPVRRTALPHTGTDSDAGTDYRGGPEQEAPFASGASTGNDTAGASAPGPERWSAKKSALVSALAMGTASLVSIGAAAAMPAGTSGGGMGGGMGGPGGTSQNQQGTTGEMGPGMQMPGSGTSGSGTNGTSGGTTSSAGASGSGTSGSGASGSGTAGQGSGTSGGAQGQAPGGSAARRAMRTSNRRAAGRCRAPRPEARAETSERQEADAGHHQLAASDWRYGCPRRPPLRQRGVSPTARAG